MMVNLACLIAALVLSFLAGWQAKDWQRDSLDLVVERAADVTGERLQAIASASGRELEKKLEAIRDAPPKEIRTELVKPVFTNRCMSDEFVSMYNAAAEKASRALSGQPAGTVSAGAAPAERQRR